MLLVSKNNNFDLHLFVDKIYKYQNSIYYNKLNISRFISDAC